MALFSKFRTVVLVVFFILFFSTPKAHAYLDPGAGGMLLQIIAGGIAGVAAILKLYWKQIIQKFKKSDKEKT